MHVAKFRRAADMKFLSGIFPAKRLDCGGVPSPVWRQHKHETAHFNSAETLPKNPAPTKLGSRTREDGAAEPAAGS
jgi:hypothetical protein